MGEKEMKMLRGEEARASWKRIFDDAVAPHAEAIVRFTLSGGIAVVVHHPHPELVQLAELLGWDGEAQVFQMPPEARREAIYRFGAIGDSVTRDWMKREATAQLRLFLIIERGSFLLNFEKGKGWSPEPGSLDVDSMN